MAIRKKAAPQGAAFQFLQYKLIILALSCRLRLLLASDTRLLVMLSLADLLLNTSLRAVSLESAQCAVQALAFLNNYIRQSSLTFPPAADLCSCSCLGIFSTLIIISHPAGMSSSSFGHLIRIRGKPPKHPAGPAPRAVTAAFSPTAARARSCHPEPPPGREARQES
jgi:hypothetical protein